MIFNQTFTDPNKKIYYPRTWGGKTIPELFEQMKVANWYIILAIFIKIVIGTMWIFVLFTFYNFIIQIWRLYHLPQNNRQRLENKLYLKKDFIYRWIFLSTALIIITSIWLNFQFTRLALIYGSICWIIILIFKKQFERLTKRILPSKQKYKKE